VRILITGDRGMLGMPTKAVLGSRHDVFGYDLPELDITDRAAVFAAVEKVKPDSIVHLAAWTDVEGAEDKDNHDRVFAVNALGTRNLVAAAEAANAEILYLSTDYVFDGEKGSPYHEWDQPNPLGHYARSKYAGELFVAAYRKHYIVRSAWLFGRGGSNFPQKILARAKKDGALKVVADQSGCPTFTVELARGLAKVVGSGRWGTYHITNGGYTTWHALAVETLRLAGMESVPVEPIPTKAAAAKVMRPRNSVLSDTFFRLEFGHRLPSWQESLALFVQELIAIGEA
jgi:dTDP-4-dehydrorhamnose reductase